MALQFWAGTIDPARNLSASMVTAINSEDCRRKWKKPGGMLGRSMRDRQGHFMDFGMYPAPPDLPTNQDGVTPDDATEEPITIGDDYRYVGPDGLYLYNIVVLTILVSLFLVIREVRAHASTLAMLERIAFCLATPLSLLPFHWVEIHTHESNLIIRKHFFGKRKVFVFSTIKQARIYSERDTRGYVTKFVGIKLKSGRSFDLFLPKSRQEELAAFIKRRIGE